MIGRATYRHVGGRHTARSKIRGLPGMGISGSLARRMTAERIADECGWRSVERMRVALEALPRRRTA
jgi:hypothetical protein